MCNAAWVINQLQGSEGSLFSIQNNMFSVLFESSEPCFYVRYKAAAADAGSAATLSFLFLF